VRKLLYIEDEIFTRLIVGTTLAETLPSLSVVSPESWEDATEEIAKLSPEDVVVTDGNLWAPHTAADVFAALALRSMTRRAVLYSSDPDCFPEFHAFAYKPQLGALVELVKKIVY
jgi:hypothetical protein